MKLFIIFSILFTSFAFAQDTLTVKNDVASYDIELDVVSLLEILEVIESFATEDAPFGFMADGCFARAHLVANWMDEENIETGKIIISLIEPGKNIVEHPFRLTAGENFKWSWHIANLVAISTEDNPEGVPMVLDLSLCPYPLNIEEYVHYLVKDEILPNDKYYSVTYCDKECFFNTNVGEEIQTLKSYAPINDQITDTEISIMRNFFEQVENTESYNEQVYFYYSEKSKDPNNFGYETVANEFAHKVIEERNRRIGK